MRMTFNQYIQNPMGIANSVISNREMYRQLYTKKLDAIMVREVGHTNRMETHTYKDGKRYIAYLKIPSETVPNFFYDVLIEFTEPKTDDKNVKKKLVGNNLEDYYVRFYSNDPSFVFTFTHAFVKNDMFFKEFSNKMSKRALKEKAEQKNPKDLVGYVKSIYFAYLLMKRKGLFNKLKYLETYNKTSLDNRVMEADKKIDARIKAGEEISKKNRREKAQNERNRKDHLEKEIPLGGNIRKTGFVNKAKSSIRSSNSIKTKFSKKITAKNK